MKSKLLEAAAEQLKVFVGDLKFENGEISGPAGTPRIPVRQLRVHASSKGWWWAWEFALRTRADKSIRPFVAHFAEVEVNKRTGEVRVLRMLAAQDSGRVMNLADISQPGDRRLDHGHRLGA